MKMTLRNHKTTYFQYFKTFLPEDRVKMIPILLTIYQQALIPEVIPLLVYLAVGHADDE